MSSHSPLLVSVHLPLLVSSVYWGCLPPSLPPYCFCCSQCITSSSLHCFWQQPETFLSPSSRSLSPATEFCGCNSSWLMQIHTHTHTHTQIETAHIHSYCTCTRFVHYSHKFRHEIHAWLHMYHKPHTYLHIPADTHTHTLSLSHTHTHAHAHTHTAALSLIWWTVFLSTSESGLFFSVMCWVHDSVFQSKMYIKINVWSVKCTYKVSEVKKGGVHEINL